MSNHIVYQWWSKNAIDETKHSNVLWPFLLTSPSPTNMKKDKIPIVRLKFYFFGDPISI